MNDLEKKLLQNFITIFGFKKKINPKDITKKNIKNWDSLNHVLLLLSIKDTFKVKFKISDYDKLNSFRQIFNYLKTNISKK